ncbi:MAG: flavin reductase [Deltaproteobacteria bacterium]|nr:flavin reductase [Deltaproteobacteria bacterium]
MKETILKNMSRVTYGIYVLTSQSGNSIDGMIASWVSQVSYDPPLLMVAIHPNRYSHELLKQSGYFALHIISREQKDLLTNIKSEL